MNLKRRNRVSAEFSMASMTDIIFLLLIFFMITSSAISQSAIDVKLPKASSGDPSIQDPTVITVSDKGLYYINDKEIPNTEIENHLKEILKKVANPSFTIRADENTKHKDIVYLMNIAEKNGYNLAIATIQESE